MRGASQVKPSGGGVPKPDRLRVLCPDETCPVLLELSQVKRAYRGLRIAVGVFLMAGGLGAVTLWWRAERRL